jgi:hypothetical protein
MVQVGWQGLGAPRNPVGFRHRELRFQRAATRCEPCGSPIGFVRYTYGCCVATQHRAGIGSGHGDDFSNDFDRFDFCGVQHELAGGNGVSLEVA